MVLDFEQVRAVARGLNRRFPAGDDPFQMMTCLLEESGELAQQVNHFEGSGIKHEKYGEPDRAKLAKEIRDVLTCTARIMDHYGVAEEVAASLETIYQRLTRDGFISPS